MGVGALSIELLDTTPSPARVSATLTLIVFGEPDTGSPRRKCHNVQEKVLQFNGEARNVSIKSDTRFDIQPGAAVDVAMRHK